MDRYILVGRCPVLCVDPVEWAEWFANNDRVIGRISVGGYRVSTIFLAIDHGFGGTTPMLFETMIFPDGEYADMYMTRCETWGEAERMHAEAIEIATRWARKLNSLLGPWGCQP